MTATSKGDFTSTPWPQILTFLGKKKLDGTLVIPAGGDGGPKKIYFVQGRPGAVEGVGAGGRLGELLVIRGIINAKVLAGALRGMKERKVRIGQYLLDEGLVTDADLGAAVRSQIEQKLSDLYSLTSEPFEFHQGENLTAESVDEMYPVDPVRSMPKALREKWSIERLDAQLTRLRGHGIRFSGKTDGEPEFDGLESESLAELKVRVTTLESALDVDRGKEMAARVTLYTLMLTGGLEFTQPPETEKPPETKPVLAQQPRAPRTPSQASKPPEQKAAAMREQTSEKLGHLDGGNYLHILEIDADSSEEEIKKSYLTLVKRFHPDRAASLDDPQLRESMVYISTKLKEALEVLTDPAKRDAWDRQRSGAPSQSEEEAIVQEALTAELNFQKAGILARKKKWDDTISLMEPIVASNPDNGEYLGLLAWARANSVKPGANLKPFEIDLRKAVSDAPRSEKVNYFLAQILKREGKDNEARSFLETVLKVNPHNIDAARELHIMKRRQGELPKKSGGGLFSGLTGRSGDKPAKSESHGRSEPAKGNDTGSTFGKLKKMLTKKL